MIGQNKNYIRHLRTIRNHYAKYEYTMQNMIKYEKGVRVTSN